MSLYQNISYNTNAKNNSNLSSILSLAEIGNFQYSPGTFVQFSRSPTLYPDRLQVVSEEFIDNYVNMTLSNSEELYYIDIVFDKPTLVHGSVVVGYNLISNYLDLYGITEENINLSDIKNLGLLSKISNIYPKIILQYTDYLNENWIDLPAGDILSAQRYSAGINKAVQNNRSLYKIQNPINNFIDLAIQEKTLQMPKMENLGVYGDKEKNTLTYLNPIGVFTQSISDPVSGIPTERRVAVVDTNPNIDSKNNLSTLYLGSNLNLFKTVISNQIINIAEPITIQKLRLAIYCPASFICNISAFYVDDQIYVPTIYGTNLGSIDIVQQNIQSSNPITLRQDARIKASDNDITYLSAKLVWEGQIYGNIDDKIIYCLQRNNTDSIDLSQAYICDKNFIDASNGMFFIDGEMLNLDYLYDSQCDFGDDINNIKILYIHNIGIKNSAIANRTVPSFTIGIDLYNIDTIQSDFIKTIAFSTRETRLNDGVQSINYEYVQSYNRIENAQEKSSIDNILKEYNVLAKDHIIYSTQIVPFNPDISKLFDIQLNIPQYTEQNSQLVLLQTSNFCQLGLNSNQYFDTDNFKILFSQQDSVNTFEDRASFVLVFMANGLGSYKDTIVIHRVITIISEN